MAATGSKPYFSAGTRRKRCSHRHRTFYAAVQCFVRAIPAKRLRRPGVVQVRVLYNYRDHNGRPRNWQET